MYIRRVVELGPKCRVWEIDSAVCTVTIDDESMSPMHGEDGAEEPAAEDGVEEGIPTRGNSSSRNYGIFELYNADALEMSTDEKVLNIVYEMLPGDLITGTDSNLEVIM